MQTKNLFKIISVILSLCLMISAFPLNFYFLNSSGSEALERTEYKGIELDADKNVTNFDDAAFVVQNASGKKMYVWLSEKNGIQNRQYNLDFFCESDSPVSVYTKSPMSTYYISSGYELSYEETEVGDTIFDNNVNNLISKTTFSLKAEDHASSVTRMEFWCNDATFQMAGKMLLAFQFGDGEIEKFYFPYIGIDSAPISDIIFTNAKDGVVQYASTEDLKLDLDVSKMDGPFEMYLYMGDVSSVNLEKKRFDTAHNAISDYCEKNNIEISDKFTFDSDNYVIGSDGLDGESNCTYSILLKDKFGQFVLNTVKTQRASVKATLSYKTKDENGKLIALTSDGNGEHILGYKNIYLDKTGDTATLSQEVPFIYGYKLVNVSVGTVSDNVISATLYTDTEIILEYEPIETLFDIDIQLLGLTVYPKNDLDKQVNDTAYNEFAVRFDAIDNNGDVDFIDTSVLFNIPTSDGKGNAFKLTNASFSTGTFKNYKEGSTVDVYEIVNGTKTLIADNVPLNSPYKSPISEEATAVELVFSEGTFKAGTTSDKQPRFSATVEYDGMVEKIVSNISANVTATYKNGDKTTISTYKNDDSAELTIINPVYTLTRKYVNAITGETIKDTMVSEHQVYNVIDKTFFVPGIPQYSYVSTKNLDKLENYDEDTRIGYMPNHDVQITYYYYAKKPYLANTVTGVNYPTVYKGDSQTYNFTGLGAYFVKETYEGNIPMYGYEFTLQIPDNIKPNKIAVPAFNGDVEIHIWYRYENGEWIELTTKANGDKINLTSTASRVVHIDHLSAEEIPVEFKVTYGDTKTKLPENFKALTALQLVADIIDDDSATANVNLQSKTHYYLEKEDASKELTEFTKTAPAKCTVLKPSVTNIKENSELTTIKDALYTFEYPVVGNNGTAPLKDVTFEYALPEHTYLDSLFVGKFTGIEGTYDIVFYDSEGKEVAKAEEQNFNQKFALTNNKIFKTIAAFEIEFNTLTPNAISEEGVVITLYSNWKNDNSSKTLVGKGAFKGVWSSQAGGMGLVNEEFTTTAKVLNFDNLKSDFKLSQNTIVGPQKISAITNSIKNENTLDVFNYRIEFFTNHASPITSIKTGAFKYTTDYDIASLKIYAYDSSNGITEIYNGAIPTTSDELTLPEGTIRVSYHLPVLPAGLTTEDAPIITFELNGERNEFIQEEIFYRVGAEKVNTDITEDELNNIGNLYAVDGALYVRIGTPKLQKPILNSVSEGKTTDKIVHSFAELNNDGQIPFYNSIFDVKLSANENPVSINLGTWTSPVSGYFYYTVEKYSNEATPDSATLETVVEKFQNVSSGDEIQIPKQDGSKITQITIVINTINPENKITSPITVTTTPTDNVKPDSIIDTQLLFSTYYGYVANENNITDEEIDKLTLFESDEYKASIKVVKPRVSYPVVKVSAETIKYRENFKYLIGNIKNAGNTKLTGFEVINAFSQHVRLTSMKTPTFNELNEYAIYYRVNTNNDWILLLDNVNSREAIDVATPKLESGQYITDVKLVFKNEISQGFASESDWELNCINWSDAYTIDDIENNTEINATFDGNTVSGRYSAYYTPEVPSILQGGFAVDYNKNIYPNQKLTFVYSNIKNATDTTIQQHTLVQDLDNNFRVIGIKTGTYEKGFSSDTIQVLYKTNLSKDGEWFLLTDKVDIETNSYLEFPELEKDEYITCIALRYGDTVKGFAEIEKPSIVVSPTTEIKNSSEYSLKASLAGTIDGKTFGEVSKLDFVTNFGFVVITVKDTNGKTITTYNEYGNVGDTYAISEVAIEGYKTISSEGDTSGTFVLGESGKITFICKEVPKTGAQIVTSWNFILGAALLVLTGIVSLIPTKKKDTVSTK